MEMIEQNEELKSLDELVVEVDEIEVVVDEVNVEMIVVLIVECDEFCDCFMWVLVDVENVCKCVECDCCEVE